MGRAPGPAAFAATWRSWPGQSGVNRVLFMLVLVGCGQQEVSSPGVAPRSLLPVAACGAPGPVVLYPRHRILSGMPPIMLLVIAEAGPVEVTLTRSSGLSYSWRTRQRTLTWPPGWPALAVGESGTVTVTACGQRDLTWFRRAPPTAPDMRWRSGSQGARWLLEQGLPMEALLLISADPGAPSRVRSAALLEVGMPLLGQWLHR